MDQSSSSPTKRVRYTEEQKNEALRFIKEYNASNKRGGQKVAAEKYNITQITLSNWMKKDKQAPKQRRTQTKKESAPSRPSTEYAALFSRLAELHTQIALLEKQTDRLDTLRQEAAELQNSLR